MKIWYVVAFAAMCCVTLSSEQSPQTPSGAAVRIEGPNILKPGDILRFTVTLTPAPEAYRGGEVRATIVNLDKSTRRDSLEGDTSATLTATLQDGVSEYSFQFPISRNLKSGEWKVGWVEFGHAHFTRINLDNQSTFNLDTDEPPITVTLSGPKTVENGQKVMFHVSIDKPVVPVPGDTCEDFLRVSFHPSGTGPASWERQYQIIYLKPGTLSYDVPFELLPDAQPIGQWSAEVRSSKTSWKAKVGCPRDRKVVGDNVRAFEVVPDPHLRVPTAAQVRLNPNEIDLLRVQASSLQHKIEDLQQKLSQGSAGQNRKVLRQSIDRALQSLDATEREFRGLETSPEQREKSTVFFDDLRTSYREVEAQLKAELRQPSGFVLVADKKPAYLLMSRAVLHALEQNMLAYTIVADEESLVFDLDVSSVPPGATVSYARRGDHFKSAPKLTNCTIKSLVYAIWTVRFEETGYKPVEIEHDPFREPNHSITAILRK